VAKRHTSLSPRQHNQGHGQYDAGMQAPPPGLPPQSGSSPHDPQQQVDPGSGGGQPTPGNYGQPGAGYGGPPATGGHGYPVAPDYSRQPPYAGYGAPPPVNRPPIQPGPGSGYAQAGYGQQPGYGPPGWNGYGTTSAGPSSQQFITWIALGIIGLLGLLAAILTFTLWLNLSSAASHASDLCDRFSGEYSTLCRHSIKNAVPDVPTPLVIYLILIIVGSLVATSGAVLLFLKNHVGQFLVLGGGIVMLTFAIVCEIRYNATGRISYDLTAGLLIAIAGGLMFIPAFRAAVGWPSMSAGGRDPGRFYGSVQSPYSQPQPPPYGLPGPGGYPPPQW
jgi:hypothetical protein